MNQESLKPTEVGTVGKEFTGKPSDIEPKQNEDAKETDDKVNNDVTILVNTTPEQSDNGHEKTDEAVTVNTTPGQSADKEVEKADIDNDTTDDKNEVEKMDNDNDKRDEENTGHKDTEVTQENVKEKRLSRSERKRKYHEELLKKMKENRKRRKLERKERQANNSNEPSQDDWKPKRDRKEETKQKCELALKIGQKICIDCSLEGYMSSKEKGKLAMQINRLYGSNRRTDKPAHIYLTGLSKEGELYQELVKKNDGFTRYLIDTEERSHTELFPLDRIIALSPDSDTVLTDIEPDKVYVIGGLVDENINKNVTSSRASVDKVNTARLPIDEYMVKLDQPPYSKILAVNQVFDILLNYTSTNNWKMALAAGFPKRKGYVVKEDKT